MKRFLIELALLLWVVFIGLLVIKVFAEGLKLGG